jgi:hypothetical protein
VAHSGGGVHFHPAARSLAAIVSWPIRRRAAAAAVVFGVLGAGIHTR